MTIRPKRPRDLCLSAAASTDVVQSLVGDGEDPEEKADAQHAKSRGRATAIGG
jgi:hypothetical protein